MTAWRDHKVRSEETWAHVRRDWEAGETGASLARRYDVGLDNLWRRRATEGWSRERPQDPAPVPVEGWRVYAARRLERWDEELEVVRDLALKLAAAMDGGPVEDVPAWHLGWLYRLRAERLGEAVAAEDRARAEGQPWAGAFWERDGTLKRQGTLDRETLRLWRADWRREVGLPDGEAEGWP